MNIYSLIRTGTQRTNGKAGACDLTPEQADYSWQIVITIFKEASKYSL